MEFLTCHDLRGYVAKLGASDAVVLEVSCGAFWWADRIEEQAAQCHVLNPYRFRIIKDSWNKTDRQDARNMAKALWVYLVTGEFGIPTVHKPTLVIRELRKLFSGYDLIDRQLRTLKNAIQAALVDEGVVLSSRGKRQLLDGRLDVTTLLEKVEVSAASSPIIYAHLQVLEKLRQTKVELAEKIVVASEPLAEQMRLLMSIRGITALSAAAFLADVGDVRRFKSQRKMSAYLGMVPRARDSGGVSRPGHINRIYQVTRSSLQLQHQYAELIERRGVGRARIAMIRRLAGIMRRMLLTGQEFRWVQRDLYEKKLRDFEKTMTAAREQRQAA